MPLLRFSSFALGLLRLLRLLQLLRFLRFSWLFHPLRHLGFASRHATFVDVPKIVGFAKPLKTRNIILVSPKRIETVKPILW